MPSSFPNSISIQPLHLNLPGSAFFLVPTVFRKHLLSTPGQRALPALPSSLPRSSRSALRGRARSVSLFSYSSLQPPSASASSPDPPPSPPPPHPPPPRRGDGVEGREGGGGGYESSRVSEDPANPSWYKIAPSDSQTITSLFVFTTA